MSRSAASIVDSAKSSVGWTAAELARAAELSTSTVSRVLQGQIDPTWSTLQKLLQATGRTLSGEMVVPANDLGIVNSAENVTDPEAAPDPTDVWVQRWARAGLLDDNLKAKQPSRILYQAGQSAPVANRPGAVFVQIDTTVGRYVATIRSFDPNATLSGIEAMSDDIEAFGNPIIYVSKPAELAQKLPPIAQPLPGRGAILLPIEQLRETGRSNADDGSVPMNRAIIDAYGTGGRVPDRADSYAEAFDQEMKKVPV